MKTPVKVYGYFSPAGRGSEGAADEFHGVAMQQADPVQDWLLATSKVEGRPEDELANVTTLFVHANFPKMNPVSLFGQDGYLDTRRHRLWGSKEQLEMQYGSDVEMSLFQEIAAVSCELEFSDDNAEDLSYRGICRKAGARIDEVYR